MNSNNTDLDEQLGRLIQLWDSYCDEMSNLEQYSDIDSFLRHDKVAPVKAKLLHHIKIAEIKAELKGMKIVNSCHGCVDNDEWLDEHRKELELELNNLEQGENDE